VPGAGGAVVRRLGEHHAVSVFPRLDAAPSEWGRAASRAETEALLAALVDLHAATPTVREVVPGARFRPVGRDGLVDALDDLDRPWSGGPRSEPARARLAERAADVRRLLGAYDRLVQRVRPFDRELVVTHGEPHSGNVVLAEGRVHLVDWDTVAQGLPERDLWIVAGLTADDLAEYRTRTGRTVDPSALEMYGLGWDLTDLAAYTATFRAPHGAEDDTDLTWAVFERVLRLEDRWEQLLG
jgi:spectinomycin phosphotransferase